MTQREDGAIIHNRDVKENRNKIIDESIILLIVIKIITETVIKSTILMILITIHNESIGKINVLKILMIAITESMIKSIISMIFMKNNKKTLININDLYDFFDFSEIGIGIGRLVS